MSIWLSWFIVDFINNLIISSFVVNDYLKQKSKITSKVIISYFLVLLILTSINTIFISNEGKLNKSIVKIMLCSILCKFIFKEKFSKATISIFLIYIVFAIYDSIFGLFYLSILHLPLQSFMENSFLILLVNGLIALLTVFTIFSRQGKKYLQNIINWYDEKNNVNLIINVFLCMLVLWVFINRNTSSNPSIHEYILNFGVIIIIMVFVIGYFKESSDKNQIKKEYDNLLDYSKTYEQEILEKSKWQHEYENQLVIIRDKIDSKNKTAISYINKLLKNKPSSENSQWLGKLTKFPDIGIKGLLHYKICQMIQQDIQVYVDVIDENLIPSKISKRLLEENLQDISMALGVYLDNAMQAALESNNKYLIVELRCTKEQILFQISNTYKGNISMDKMKQERFSTKGKGHGYGLSIVRDILLKNKYLSQESEINGIYYVQKLIINIKK